MDYVKLGFTAPTVGATKPHQLDDAAAAIDLTLTADELTGLASGYLPHPIEGFS